MPLLVFLFLILTAVVGYFAQLNPDRVSFFVTQDRAYLVSLTALILFSAASGGLLVMIASGVRQTRALYLNWTYRKRQKKEEQMESAYKEGVNAFLAKRTRQAVSQFQKVLTIQPNHLNTLLRLGEIHRTEKNIPEAIRLHRQARLSDDKSLEPLLQLAKDFEAAGQWDEALVPLKEMVARDETHFAGLAALRDIYVRLSRWEDAHTVSEKILKLSLSDEVRQAEQALFLGIKCERGAYLLEQHQSDTARRSFKSAIKIDKKFLPAYMGLVEAYMKEARIESAMTLLEKGYDITGNLILLHRLEDLCLEQGQPDRILQAYQKVLTRSPNDLVLKFFLGKLYYRLEMVDEAFDILSEVEAAVSYFPDLHKILGKLYLRRGESLWAAEAFSKALRLKNGVIVPYSCPHCDYQTTHWSGRCVRCGQWNSYDATPVIIEKGQKKEPVPFEASLSPLGSRPKERFE
jgi:lipopolysaccharide biosynthesis regulator YciM